LSETIFRRRVSEKSSDSEQSSEKAFEEEEPVEQEGEECEEQHGVEKFEEQEK
jgi:hypothetical protein